MSKAILVFGSESSGTRLTTRLFTESDFYGQYTHSQSLDQKISNLDTLANFVKHEQIERIVFRRSIPHDNNIPDMKYIYTVFKSVFSDVRVIVTMRSFPTLVLSQCNNNHVNNIETAYNHVYSAYKKIFEFLNELNPFYYILDFGSLINYPQATIHSMSTQLSVDMNIDILCKIIKTNIERDRIEEYMKKYYRT